VTGSIRLSRHVNHQQVLWCEKREQVPPVLILGTGIALSFIALNAAVGVQLVPNSTRNEQAPWPTTRMGSMFAIDMIIFDDISGPTWYANARSRP